jgi:hypothetical protein
MAWQLYQLETKVLFVALLVGLAHIVSGVAVLVDGAALRVAPLESLQQLAMFLGFGGQGEFSGPFLIIAGIMAVVGSSRGVNTPKVEKAILFAPQQFLLFLQLISISVALATGKYPDGYAPTGRAWFILADQSWAFILAMAHLIWVSAYIYRGARSGNRR